MLQNHLTALPTTCYLNGSSLKRLSTVSYSAGAQNHCAEISKYEIYHGRYESVVYSRSNAKSTFLFRNEFPDYFFTHLIGWQ